MLSRVHGIAAQIGLMVCFAAGCGGTEETTDDIAAGQTAENFPSAPVEPLLDASAEPEYFYDETAHTLYVARMDSTEIIHLDPSADTAVSSGALCHTACLVAAGLGCAGVSGVCAWGTVFTVGAASIPCSWAIMAACTSAGLGLTMCQQACGPV